MIKYNTYGKIIQGTRSGWFIYVEAFHDGDFQVFITDAHPKKNVEPSEGFDNYFRNVASLELHFEIQNWEIEWENTPDDHI